MKSYVILALVFTCFMNTAFAIHAYRSDVCKIGKISVSYQGNYAVGGHYSAQNGEGEPVYIIPADSLDEYADEDVASMPYFSVVKETKGKTKITKASKDDCFEKETTRYEKVLYLTRLSKAQEENLGLNNNVPLKLKCVTEYSFPTKRCMEE